MSSIVLATSLAACRKLSRRGRGASCDVNGIGIGIGIIVTRDDPDRNRRTVRSLRVFQSDPAFEETPGVRSGR